jgi:hypothetical protein
MVLVHGWAVEPARGTALLLLGLALCPAHRGPHVVH